MKRATSEQKPAKKALTVAEAAALVGLTEHALWQRIYRGQFPHRRWGRSVIVLQDELDQFLQTLPGPALGDITARVETLAR
ncbi:MAG TPA: helix-turn-helix domain-containing protein [Candidatus Binatia bacterium]|nr:helix-turn-helix domain-containing protein [Candidatus Binatia bacterium]